MRRSISLSPIRTESGANLRTANWTRLKFRGPHQQNYNRNYNNYNNNYQNYNNRGYHNQRYQNRGRGYHNYRNQNFTTTRYIPRRRYNSNNRRDDSRSRSRSYSRSASRGRSRSRSRYSRSRSRSASERQRSRSPSSSPELKGRTDRHSVSSKNSTKADSQPYYSSAQTSKSEMEFPEKVATDLDRWGSPTGFTTFQSSANKKMQEALAKNTNPDEVQEKMKKTALESVARHEKSLHKIKLEQNKKMNSDSEQSDDDIEIVIPKKKKKTKKKKAKVAKIVKKKQKAQKIKVEISDSNSSESDSSEEKSSDEESSGSSPPPKKSKTAAKKKKTSKKEDGSSAKLVQAQQPTFFYPPGGMGQGSSGQPMMMMAAPNMAAGDMKFVGPYGQPMNMIKIEMPGPDGKMMQFYQFPTMAQGAMQPVVMASSVGAVPQQATKPTPQPVPKPAASATPPAYSSHLKVVPIQEDPTELPESEPMEIDSKDLSEKQKRRKEVIRTRLWPRPAETRSPKDGDQSADEQSQNQTSDSQPSDWPLKTAEKADGNFIPGLSSPHQEPDEVQGQKIPTLAGSGKFANAGESTQDEVIEEEEVLIDDEPVSVAPTTMAPAVNQAGLVSYPQIVHGAYNADSNYGFGTTYNQPGMKHEGNKQHDQRWSNATEEFIRGDKSQPSSDGECSTSSDDQEQIKYKQHRGSEGKKALKIKERAEEEAKKAKKKKKNKKERKISVASEDVQIVSPVMKDKKRKKKKKNKDKDADEISETDSKASKKGAHGSGEGKKKKDDLQRDIPQELSLAHIRGLVPRRANEGIRSVFVHVDFSKLKKTGKSLREAHDTYEDQFVSLFHEETTEVSESPLNMTRSALKKLKIRPQGTRSVTHMTKITLCERIAQRLDLKEKFQADNASQKVSVNLASLSTVEDKFDLPRGRSRSRSLSRSSKSSRSLSKSRSSKSPSKSRSPRKYRVRSPSRSSYSSQSRSRSKSLPKAYSVGDERGRDDDRRTYRREGNRYQNPHQQQGNYQQFRYNQNYRYQNRGRGNYYNNRGNFNNRGNYNNYYNNRGNYNNRGYFNRNRGYYNNNNNRDRQQWRPNYNRDRRDSDRGDRSFERRSYTRSPERRRASSSYSSDKSERRDRSLDRSDHSKHDIKAAGNNDARNVIEDKQNRKSPIQWAHDKYDENDDKSD